jgi:hypothetical protein
LRQKACVAGQGSSPKHSPLQYWRDRS